ncbi:YtcA family lipoprotein [Escherichia coli]|uniref:YtcA family lipoprotein n=1 Tax=Escherichia coli TaxID=562 RepID=UPI0038B65EF5
MVHQIMFSLKCSWFISDKYGKRSGVISLIVSMVSSLAGCTWGGAPSFTLLGSFVPYWIFCVTMALILTVIIRASFIKWGIDDAMPLRLVVYVCLMLTLTFLFSLLFL